MARQRTAQRAASSSTGASRTSRSSTRQAASASEPAADEERGERGADDLQVDRRGRGDGPALEAEALAGDAETAARCRRAARPPRRWP